MIAAWAVGIDPEGRRRVIWGAWPASLLERFAGVEGADDQSVIARVTSLADRFHLQPEVRS